MSLIDCGVYQIDEERWLADGIYEFGDEIEVLYVHAERGRLKDNEEINEFIKRFPDYVFGSAYETYGVFFLSSRPEDFSGKEQGSGFNYGSNNLLSNVRKGNLLILAEDD